MRNLLALPIVGLLALGQNLGLTDYPLLSASGLVYAFLDVGSLHLSSLVRLRRLHAEVYRISIRRDPA